MKSKKIFIFTLIFIVFSTTIIINWPNEFYFDSKNYVDLSTEFIKDGVFSFANFPPSHRGYLWPLLLFFFRTLFGAFGISQMTSIYIGTTILYSLVFSFVIPYVFEKIFDANMNGKEIVLALLVCVFWSDLIIYPLTDIFGFSLILLGVVAAIKCKESQTTAKLAWAFLLGVIVYSLYNVRSMTAIISVLLLIGYVLVYSKLFMKKIIILCFVLGGILFAGLPQSLANVKNYSSYNSALSIASFDKENESLTLYQLRLGIYIRKYDTVVENAKLQNNGVDTRIIYSPTGVSIIEKYNIETLQSYSQYIGLVIRNPVQFTRIYYEHFISYLDVQRGVYMRDLDDKIFIKYSNLFLWFCFFIILIFRTYQIIAHKRLLKFVMDTKALLIIAIIFPVILTFPGVPELRFFFPVYMMMYMILIYEFNLLSKIWNIKKIPTSK